METYCASSKKRTANKNSSVRKTKKNRWMLSPICAVCVCGKKKKPFIKYNELHNYDNVSNH